MRTRSLITDNLVILGADLCEGLLREGNGAPSIVVDKSYNCAWLAPSIYDQFYPLKTPQTSLYSSTKRSPVMCFKPIFPQLQLSI